MGSDRDKQHLVDSVYFTIHLNCRIILENGSYANFDSVKISFSSKNFASPSESFAPENLGRVPPKKFLAVPPEKILEESQLLLLLLLLFNIMLYCNTVKIF